MNINEPDSQWAKLIQEGERKQKLAGWLDQVSRIRRETPGNL